jgi:ABC-2 type transport system ATP-binding protein
MKILSTLVLPTAGSARVNGYDVVRDPAAVRRSIGYIVADERSFYGRLTGRQNLCFFATLNNLTGKERDRRVEALLQLLMLEGEADRAFHSYSTGTKQKLAIARGLLHDPPVVLLDEPTRSLDLPAARAVHQFVRDRLSSRGRTVLLATHNMHEASELCTRVAMIAHGELKAWGTPAEIAAAVAPAGRRLTLEVEGWTEETTRRLRRLSAVQEVHCESTEDGVAAYSVQMDVAEHGKAGAVADVVEAVVSCGGRISAVRDEVPSLGELFLRATGDWTTGERCSQSAAPTARGASRLQPRST